MKTQQKITTSIISFLSFFFRGIYKVINSIHNIIPEKIRIYVYLLLIVIFTSVMSIITFKKEIHMFFLDIHIKYQEFIQQKAYSNFKSSEYELNEQIEIVTKEITNKIMKKKELCVENTYLETLKNLRKKEIVLNDVLKERILNDINFNKCSFEEIRKNEITYMLDIISKKFNSNFETNLNKELDKIQVKEEQEKEKKINIDDNHSIDELDYYSFLDKTPGAEEEKYESKYRNKKDLKAVFCSYGHGITNSKKLPKDTLDPGYVINKSDYSEEERNILSEYVNKYAFDYVKESFNKYQKLTERQLIEMINPNSCKKLKEELKPKGIKVYEIGREKLMSLSEKINLINEISTKNGYDQYNSIVYELHSNSVGRSEKSGLEVFYSHYEQHNNNMQGRDLAITVLNSIASLHKKYTKVDSTYVVKPDGKSKHAYLGITSATKPLGVLIEYGFKKNLNDITFMLSHQKEIGESIAQGFLNFVN